MHIVAIVKHIMNQPLFLTPARGPLLINTLIIINHYRSLSSLPQNNGNVYQNLYKGLGTLNNPVSTITITEFDLSQSQIK